MNVWNATKMKSRRGFWLGLSLLLFAIAFAAAFAWPSLRPGHTLPERMRMRETALDGFGVASVLEWKDDYVAAYYPRTDSEPANAAIHGYIANAIAAFREKSSPSRRVEKDEFSVRFRVFRFDKDVVSFLFQSDAAYTGGKGNAEDLHAMTFDLSTGEYLGLASLFESQDCLGVLSEKAYPQLKKLLAPAPESFEQFVLDGNTLRFYYPPGGGDQPNSFEVPLTQLRALLRPRFAAALPPPPPELKTWPISEHAPKPDVNGLKEKKLIALTFDDGPHPQNTPKLLNILKKEDVRATFFVLGSMAKDSPGILQRAAAEGHQIASHTYSHKNLTKLSADKLKHEIDDTDAVIASIVGYAPSAMRPPYGSYNKTVSAAAHTPLILWSIDPWDWKYRNAEKVSKAVISKAADGDIILLHDLYASTVEAARIIIPALKAKGFTFVTVDELLALRGEGGPGVMVSSRRPG